MKVFYLGLDGWQSKWQIPRAYTWANIESLDLCFYNRYFKENKNSIFDEKIFVLIDAYIPCRDGSDFEDIRDSALKSDSSSRHLCKKLISLFSWSTSSCKVVLSERMQITNQTIYTFNTDFGPNFWDSLGQQPSILMLH